MIIHVVFVLRTAFEHCCVGPCLVSLPYLKRPIYERTSDSGRNINTVDVNGGGGPLGYDTASTFITSTRLLQISLGNRHSAATVTLIP